jgi:hypothetical protein
MKHFHLIEAKYVGATNTRGSRIKLTSLRFPNDSFTVSYNYKFSNALDIAIDELENIGVKIVGYGYDEKKGNYILSTETFEPIKQLKNRRGLSEKIPGRSKDTKFYNAAQKHERAYLPKRKTVRKYKK